MMSDWPTPLKITYLGYNTVGGSTTTGSSSTITHIMKKITTPTGNPLLALSLDVYMKGDGTHVGTLLAGIQTDNSGAPGPGIICQGNYAGNGTGGGIVINFKSDTTARWVSVPMGCVLAANTSYWLRFSYGGSSTAAAMNVYYDSGSDYSTNDNNTWFNPGSIGSAGARMHSCRLSTIPVIL